MSIKYSIEDGRLAVDFIDEHRSVFIKGKQEGDALVIEKDHFDDFPSLSREDKNNIRQAIIGDSRIIID